MTDGEIEDYVRHLRAHLPPAHGHLTVEQIRAVLDAESTFFEHRFGPVHGWRAMLRAFFGRGVPSPEVVEAARPEFEAYVVRALAGRGDLTREDIVAVMQVEGEAGPSWTRPTPGSDAESDTAG